MNSTFKFIFLTLFENAFPTHILMQSREELDIIEEVFPFNSGGKLLWPGAHVAYTKVILHHF